MITRDQVNAICPDCASLMEKAGIEDLDAPADARRTVLARLVEIWEAAKEDKDPDALEAIQEIQLAEKGGGIGKSEPGFHTRCMSHDFGRELGDKAAFCAWLHKRVLKYSPGSKKLEDGVRTTELEGVPLFNRLAKDGDHRLFLHLSDQPAEGAPEWVPYLPLPGVYKHPVHGDLAFTPERNARFVTQFKSKVYQETIPVDAEHQTKLSGAMGHITDMRQNKDGSVDARVAWTDRGRTMMGQKAFRYFSPEFFTKWTDPATGKEHEDVASGGALTNRPFFKDTALRPIISMSFGLYGAAGLEADEEVRYFTPMPRTVAGGEGGQHMSKDKQTNEDLARFLALTEDEQVTLLDEARKLTEENETLKKQIDAVKASEDEKDERIELLSERVDEMEAKERTRRFTELVRASDPWYGDEAKHVSLLSKLAGAFGEDSEEFKGYVENQKALAKQLKESVLFKTVGSDDKGGDSDAPAGSKIVKLAEARAAEKKISLTDAIVEIQGENPELYDEDKKQTQVKV